MYASMFVTVCVCICLWLHTCIYMKHRDLGTRKIWVMRPYFYSWHLQHIEFPEESPPDFSFIIWLWHTPIKRWSRLSLPFRLGRWYDLLVIARNAAEWMPCDFRCKFRKGQTSSAWISSDTSSEGSQPQRRHEIPKTTNLEGLHVDTGQTPSWFQISSNCDLPKSLNYKSM